MQAIYTTTMPSPIGTLRLRATEDGLTHVFHENQQSDIKDSDWTEDPNHPHLAKARCQLDDYFAGNRKTFNVPLAPEGTDFQRQVWMALRNTPYGQITSYAEIADQIGNPKAVRAVGAANGRNPLSIFVPCHRVIGKNGTLTGYAGGLGSKSALLAIERGEQELF